MIDSHVHLDLPNEEYITTKSFLVKNLLENMQKYNVSNSVVFLNAGFKKLYCLNFLDKSHKTKLVSDEKTCKLVCAKCGKVLYNGKDCFHDYNIKLLEEVKPYNNLKPLVFLASCPDTINEEVEFFENKYGNEFYGYKIYPRLFSTTMNNIDINSTKPVLIHDTHSDLVYSQSIIDFAKRYKGNVIVAHAGHFKTIMFDAVNKLPNLYMDFSPFCFLFDGCDEEQKKNALKVLLFNVNNDKIFFGTDAPYGDYKEEIEFVKNLNLDKEVFEKITRINAQKVFNIGENNGK